MKCDEDPGVVCHDIMSERIRYFTGRHMTARDFRDADAYHRSYRYLHNRVLHGWGIACGLEVEPHPRPECRRDRVVVRCGLALDCCGREIVVRKDLVTERIKWDERPKTSAGSADMNYVLLLCLKFKEFATEKVPVLYNPNACSTPSIEDGRIRECYDLHWHWVPKDKLDEWGWRTPAGCAPPDETTTPPKGSPVQARQYQDDDEDEDDRPYGYGRELGDERPCPDEGPNARRCCLELDCTKEHCVALAVIAEPPDSARKIDTSGRRSISQAREHLTHVCWTSWTHGTLVRLSELRGLRVRFDRPLQPAVHPHPHGPRGINERTFVVQFGEQSEDMDFVEYRRPPYLTADRRTAVYEIRNPRRLLGHVVHVTLKCDFILDCNNNAVDADHVRGRLPSGNGLQGGTFESWFLVVDDDEYDKYHQGAQQTAGQQEHQS